MIKRICKTCKKEFYVWPHSIRNKQGKFCSSKCYGVTLKEKMKGNKFSIGRIPWNKNKKCPQLSGKNHWNWKGQTKTTQGYICIQKPSHPKSDIRGYVRRSILVMEKHLGRHFIKNEIVHHKNGIKTDDRLKNLKLFPNNSVHIKFHYSTSGLRRFHSFRKARLPTSP